MSEKMMLVRINGRHENAFTWSEYTRPPRQYQGKIDGTVDGIPTEFPKSNGKGQGTFKAHYLWFHSRGAWWMLPTGNEWPLVANILTSDTIETVSRNEVYKRLREKVNSNG